MTSHRILLVDDEPDILHSLEGVLGHPSTGLEIVTARSAEEALVRLDGVDMVVSDHRMPGMTGVELLAQVRRERPDVTRILVTAYGELEVTIAALERAEVHYYLRKPYEPNEMRSLIATALERASTATAARTA